MRENTPPRHPEIEEDEGEIIIFDNDVPPPPDDGEDDELDLSAVEELDEMIRQNREDGTFENRSPVPDDAASTFVEHCAAVFGGSLHPTKDLAVTGGEDDKAFIWDTFTCDVMYEVEGHKDTVIEANFNHDGTYFATGDMAGEIQVFKNVEDPQKIWSYSMGDMAWMRWHRSANVLIAGSENGEIYIWRIPSGDCKILPGNGVKCECGELTGDGKKLFAGYSNGNLKLWDIKNTSVVMEVDQQNPISHRETVTTVSCEKDSPLYMSGGEDGKIIFCTNNGPVGAVEASGPVESVAFSPSSEMKVAASGTLHGQIAIWDYTKYSMRTLCEHPELDDGVTKLKWISDYTLIVGTIQGKIYAYDARTGVRKFSLSGHLADIYDMQYDPEREILLSVSEDLTAKIFKVPQLGD